MTLVVPFDGSELSKAALVRAAQFETVLHEGVVAVSVIPRRNANYAREKGWLGPDELFDIEQIMERLRRTVKEIAPDAEFHHVSADRWAQSGGIATKVRQFARDADATIVFIGSENAGRIVQSLSVGSTVATDRAYDTMIISHVSPTEIEELNDATVSVDQND